MEIPIYPSPDETPKEPEAPPEEVAPEDSTEPDDEELVRRAHAHYRLGTDTLSQWRIDALEDLSFLAGEQWDPVVKGQRDVQGRPALTVNRLPQFVRQVTNEQRQSKPSVTVNPIDSESDVRTADVLQGIIRNIEYTSNADAAYAAGGASAAITGLGFWDVCAEYEDERSFEQKLSIRRIRNALSVVMDPSAKEVSGDDARWVITSSDMSKGEWKATYPDREEPIGGGWEGHGDAPDDWVSKDGIRIHEYRYISECQDTLIDVSDASPLLVGALKMANIDVSTKAILESEVGPDFARQLKEGKCSTRPTTKRKACYAKIAGDEVIERGELAGRYLQIVRVVGTEIDVNGKPIYEGVIRHAKDTQRVVNYMASAESEAIALAPKAPFIVAEGQTEGYRKDWEQANQKPLSVLTYKPTTIAGVAVPPPQRVMAEANIGAITTARQQAGQDLSDVTGIYPTQFGAPSPEQSGKAILARQTQGQTSNFHFTDNLAMAIRYTGRILVDLIPKIYTGPRVMRIIGEDETQEMVPVNGAEDPKGEPVIQLNAGRYDVAVNMGPSYLSRRQEASTQMLEFVRIYPQAAPIIGDLLVGNMDIPGGQAIADRLRKLLPPEIRPPDDKLPPQQVMAQTIQQLQVQSKQMGAMFDQLVEALHNAHDRIDAKEQELASKERIAILQSQVALLTVKAKLNSSDANAALDRQMEVMSQRLELDGINEPLDETSTTEAPRGPLPPLPSWQKPPPITPAPPQGVTNAATRAPGLTGAPNPSGGPIGLPPGAPPFGTGGPGGNSIP